MNMFILNCKTLNDTSTMLKCQKAIEAEWPDVKQPGAEWLEIVHAALQSYVLLQPHDLHKNSRLCNN